MNTTAATWLGSTVACAQCHNHKFDPISQKDYYRLLAFFDNADYRVEGLGEVVRDKWIVEPELELAPAEVLKTRDTLKAEAEALKKTIDAQRSRRRARGLGARARVDSRPTWTVLRPVRFVSAYGAALEEAKDGSLLVSAAAADRDTYTVTVRVPPRGHHRPPPRGAPRSVAARERSRPFLLGQLRPHASRRERGTGARPARAGGGRFLRGRPERALRPSTTARIRAGASTAKLGRAHTAIFLPARSRPSRSRAAAGR